MAVGRRLGGHGITSGSGAVTEQRLAAFGGYRLAGRQSVQQRIQSFQAIDMVAIGDVGVETAAIDQDRQEAGVTGALDIGARLVADVHGLFRAQIHALEGGFEDKSGRFFAGFAAGNARIRGTGEYRGSG